jgi:16S rRNA pseudouridine516 synthase
VTRMRLDRALANLGYGTRRQAQRAVRDGRVCVAGQVVRSPEHQADPAEVTLDGEALEFPEGLLVALHKPIGAVCSHDDRDGMRIYDLLPARWLQRNPQVTSVGRLDKDSSGLLLITDLLGLVHDLTSPRHHVEKRYVVRLQSPLDDDERATLAEVFSSGELVLRGEERPCAPAQLRAADDDRLEVVLTEGRHRQLRRMFAATGHHVEELVRLAVGPYQLGDLAPGEWRAEDPTLVSAAPEA